MSARAATAAVTAVAALALAACGSDGPEGPAGATTSAAETPDEATSTGGDEGEGTANAGGRTAETVAANLAEPNLILDGGQAALERKLAELDGAPVVVNQWASWCPPCREELPFFNDSAEDHADAGDVAFLGTNYLDDRGAAESYLTQVPVVFPSIFDPDGDVTRSLEGGLANPSTMFLDGSGDVVYVRKGAYPDRDALEADIQAHLLSG